VVSLAGWVATNRDHGGLVFVDVRDRYGLTQVVFNPENDSQLHARARQLKPEYVIRVKGEVSERPAGTVNPRLSTGEIEVLARELEILNTSETPPIPIEEDSTVSGDLRLKYRYLDLRRGGMQRNLQVRHKAYQSIRHYYDRLGFLEVETPMLTKSTPEGARDYLVPSRMYPGKFYALPQSPQLFKQLFMIGGLDRYFQIVRCYRDEDLRADRQPEFTQLDVELAFAEEEDIYRIHEGLMQTAVKEVMGREIDVPFTRMTYAEAITRYGCDKPDLRFGLELVDASDWASKTPFEVFRKAVADGGQVKGINARRAELSRRELDELTEFVKGLGGGGLVWVRVKADGLQSPVARFFDPSRQQALRERFEAGEGDTLFLVADRPEVVAQVLSELRLKLGERLGLIDASALKFCWIVDAPLFQWNEELRRWDSVHHPFTAPREEDLEMLEADPGRVRSRSYDLVFNGTEIASGSIRIHRVDVQERVFKILGIGAEEARRRFGFFLEALKYGAPPHGGIAFGFDRFVMKLLNLDSIREVIAFPKTQRAVCPLTSAPDEVDPAQLKELGL
jgi:aspartyl-tRNA synthetase